MRRPLFLIAINAVILVSLFGWMLRSMLSVERAAVAVAVEGTAEIRRLGKNEWQPLGRYERVYAGDKVRCAQSSTLELASADGAHLRLQPNSLLSMKTSTINPLTGNELAVFRLSYGHIDIRLQRDLPAPSDWVLETEFSRTHSHWGSFSVSLTGISAKTTVQAGSATVENTVAIAGSSAMGKALSPRFKSSSISAGRLSDFNVAENCAEVTRSGEIRVFTHPTPSPTPRDTELQCLASPS
jgi:hypothetical protein